MGKHPVKVPCHYCGEKFFDLTADHIVPSAHGGRDKPWNKVRACAPCNFAKADSWPTCVCVKCKYSVERHERLFAEMGVPTLRRTSKTLDPLPVRAKIGEARAAYVAAHDEIPPREAGAQFDRMIADVRHQAVMGFRYSMADSERAVK